MLSELLVKKNMSIYECSKKSGIPYTTLSEIVRGKTSLAKCSSETLYKLSKVLKISMERVYMESETVEINYELFKSNVCHRLKNMGDIDFIIHILKTDPITYYWNKKWYFESFYLLAMLDYISKLNYISLCSKYNKIRNHQLTEIHYPQDIELISKIKKDSKIKEEILEKAIPEFLRYNIVEIEVRDAV